jgi:hypothetical protein
MLEGESSLAHREILFRKDSFPITLANSLVLPAGLPSTGFFVIGVSRDHS